MNVIKSAIIRSGYTEKELMYKLGVSEQTILDWEEGVSVPTLDELFDFVFLLDLSFRELALNLGYSSVEISTFYKIRGAYYSEPEMGE